MSACLIPTWGNASCHSGFLWRILTQSKADSDLLPAKVIVLVQEDLHASCGSDPCLFYATDSPFEASFSFRTFPFGDVYVHTLQI